MKPGVGKSLLRRCGRLCPLKGRPTCQRGYLLVEALVYISAVGILLTVGLIAMFRCVDNSLVLRRNANDIARAVHIGELWRSEVRAATNLVRLRDAGGEILQLEAPARLVQYRFSDSGLCRRVGSGPWGCALEQVKTSSMHPEPESPVPAWHWDLELQPRSRGLVAPARMRPLFTFIAVPHVPAQRP